MPCTDAAAARKYQREWRRLDRAKHPEKYSAYKRKHYEKHRADVIGGVKLYEAKNREAIRARKRAIYRKANKRLIRDAALARKYGISLATYEEMHAAQNGECAICRQQRRLVVDHCHETQVVRGLLCSNCNVAIGLLGECVASIMRAVTYLEGK